MKFPKIQSINPIIVFFLLHGIRLKKCKVTNEENRNIVIWNEKKKEVGIGLKKEVKNNSIWLKQILYSLD